ncbi:MAG: nucleoside-diphosphate-sugar epimerase, partial [Psychroserpens sp.]
SKILVTGASGFLGSHIADALSDLGHQVTVFDLHESPYLRADQAFMKGDVRDAEALLEQTKGFDVIYHLAALADLNAAKSKPMETVSINIQGTVNLLEAARVNGIKRFVFGSTVYVYSKEGGFYRCSKQACENYVEEYQKRYGLDYMISRYGSLYGPRTDELGGNTINHGDVIKPAVELVVACYENLENVVLLLGNTVNIKRPIFDKYLQKLDDERALDSYMTVWEAQDDHHYRAMEISDKGLLRPHGIVERNVSTDRQSYKKAYYYDRGVWALRKYTT